jgi:DNA-directed RNA polymerase specialized sigma24 family protein
MMQGKDVTRRSEFLRALDRIDRYVLALCYGEGLSLNEAALVLGCPVPEIESSLARLRELATTMLGGRAGEPAVALAP